MCKCIIPFDILSNVQRKTEKKCVDWFQLAEGFLNMVMSFQVLQHNSRELLDDLIRTWYMKKILQRREFQRKAFIHT